MEVEELLLNLTQPLKPDKDQETLSFGLASAVRTLAIADK